MLPGRRLCGSHSVLYAPVSRTRVAVFLLRLPQPQMFELCYLREGNPAALHNAPRLRLCRASPQMFKMTVHKDGMWHWNSAA